MGAGDRARDLPLGGRYRLHHLQVYGRAKSGAAYGYTKVLGYHPIVAVRAGGGEILHARMRKGSANTARGTKRLSKNLWPGPGEQGRAARSSCALTQAFGPMPPSPSWDAWTCASPWPCAVATAPSPPPLPASKKTAWEPIAYTPDGIAEVAETGYKGHRLVVRRTRLVDVAQQALFPGWRHHGFLSDLEGSTVELDRFHRQHATVELAIRDIKEGSGLAHCPSGNFAANGAWLACAVLAHNLCRWTALVGQVHPDDQLTVAATLRSQLIAVPGRLVNRAGTPVLRGPLHWPWQHRFDRALAKIRALPAIASG